MHIESDYLEILADCKWEHPSSYFGFSPDGDYLILSQHRDSDVLTRSNWIVGKRILQVAADKAESDGFHCVENRDEYGRITRAQWAYSFSVSSSLVGWIDYLLVRQDAPESVLIAAAEIVSSLADYPILDETHFSEMEWEENIRFWEESSVRNRIDMIKASGSKISIFAARRDEFPSDDAGRLFEYISGI